MPFGFKAPKLPFGGKEETKDAPPPPTPAGDGPPWESGRLAVEVLGARGLRAADKSGTSDPFVCVQLVNNGKALPKPHDKAHKTRTIKKTLAPRYKDEHFVFDDVPLQTLRFQVYDWNAGLMGMGSGKAKPLGEVSVDLAARWAAQPDPGPDGRGVAEWLKLDALEGQQGAGEVEVKILLTPGTGDAQADAAKAADSARWFVDDQEPEKGEPNVLHVAVVRARGLKAADKSLMGSASSDPFVTLQFGDKKEKTDVVKKSLEPIWMKMFELPVPVTKDKKPLPSLDVLVQDHDTLSSDFLGKVTISPASIPALEQDGAAPPTWFPLSNKDGSPAADRGQIQLALKMVYDPQYDPSEDRPFFTEEITEIDKAPNELRIAIARARDLKAMDAAVPFSSKGKTSDPYVKVKLEGFSEKKTKTRMKTLAPVWNDSSFTFDLVAGQKGASTESQPKEIEFQVMDYDLVGSDDFLGLVVLKLDELLEAKHKPVSKWYPLGEKTQRSGGDGSRGSLQVIAQWRYNKDLDFEPFSAEDDVVDREPNEVRVALFRGRGLAIKDKNLLSKGGTSDPRVRFELLGGQFSDDKNERKKQEKERHFKSSVRKKTLDPVWREVFARELRQPKKDDQVEGKWSPPTLRCICEDVDKVGSADFMGCVDIALTPLLEKRETLAGWYALGPDPDGKSSSNVSGEIHVSVQWRFDPELDFDPWCDEEGGDKPPNELRVALAKGRDLSVKDKPVLWGEGTSDPRVSFSLQVLGNDKAETPLKPWHSRSKKKTLNPTWNETYTHPLPPPEEGEPGWVLTATCEDVDGLSSADFMGKVDIELESILKEPKRRSRQWHHLEAVDGKSSNVTGELDIVVQWRYNPALDFDPWLDEEKDPKHADKDPNELRIALVQGRSLAVKDKAVLYGAGSSDPRVRFKITGTKDLHCASKCIKKSLDPSWRETFSLPLTKDYSEDEKPIDFGINGPILEVTCEDVDTVSSADFMGELNLPIHAVEKKRVRKWYPLEADAEGKHKSSNIHGELELILEWCYNPELDFDPFVEDDKYPEKPPNEVCVGLGRGRHLAIKDKAVLYGEGSSDPRCTLRIDGTELKEVSAVKKTTLNPIWNQTFTFPYSRGPDDSQPPELVIECEDVDTVTAADFMGLVRVELDPLKDHARFKKWVPLQAKADDKASSNISGDLEVIVRWRYNPELDFDPYPDAELKPEYKDKEPNELRLALVQARGLAIKDKNLLSKGGSSDPFASFEVTGGDTTAKKPFKSKTKYKTLCPRWNELFQVPLKKGEVQPRLEVLLYDEDEVSSPDFMGRISIEISEFCSTKAAKREWFTLLPEEGKSDNVKGAVELIAQWWYNPALDFEPFMEPDEHADAPPNELRVAIVAARDLAIKDKNLLSKGGSSDPRCTLTVSGTELKAQSSTKQKTLEPRWCEVFSFEYTPGSDSENPPVLDVLVEDIDTVSSADFMGRARVELEPLKNQRLRKWFPLSADSEGKKGSSNVTGDLELVVQWRHNPALAFAPFADEVEVPEGKKPNELRVAAIQARRLAVKDKSMMGKGTSDPVVTFELGSVKAETTVKKKTLNPTWKESFAKPCSVDEAGDCQLKVSVGDWDAVTARDFMGSCLIDLKACVDEPNQPACRKWCLLDLQDDEKTQNVSGEVEIWYQWRYNPLLDFEPFTDVESDKAPNVLRVGLSQGRGLAVMDKNLLSKGGSSDPRCVISLVDGEGAVVGKPITSAHQSKTLEPKWREVHEFDVEDASLSFKCVVEDYDALSKADHMGEVTVALSELPQQKVVRKWHSLGDEKGEVELVLQWCYDADRDFEAFPEIDESAKMPNELCVGVFRARNLAVKDKGIVGKGSSDPYVKLKVAGTTLERRTKVKKTTLDPVWKELFILPLSSERPPDKPTPQLEVSCWDHDTVSGDDAMGTATLDLSKWTSLAKRTGEKVWLPLEGEGASGDVCVVVVWRFAEARAFDPFEDEPLPEGKEPNELRIGLFQATGLAVKDKALLWGEGSSDPRMTFSVDGTALKCTSETVKKSLDPTWKQVMTLELPRGPAGGLKLLGKCEDVDEVSGADFMGQFEVDLNECLDGKVKRLWRSLAPRTEKDEVSGDVELVLQWRYNARLDFCPFDGFVDEHEGEAPNELRIALIRAQGLAIADKNLLSKGGSSDPRCTFELTGVDDPWKSHTVKKCLDPKFHEQFVRLLDVPGDGSSPSLTVTCEDVDEVSGADFMGQFTVDIGPLKDHKPVRKWYKLEESDKRKGDVAGHVELFLQWVYNPVTAFEPFAPSETEGEPNELRIGLGRARDLPAMDKALVGKSSSDPRCTFTVDGTAIKLQSSTKKSTLTPTWKETFEVALPKGPPETKWQLTIDMEDWDRVSAADHMGRVTVDLEPLADQAIVKGWYPLQTKDGGDAQGEVYLVLQWRRNRDLAFEPFEDQTEAEFLAKEPNELRIAAVGALGLAVADKNLLSSGGSSDPFLTFSLEGSTLKPFKTAVKKKSLDPVWHEQFARSVTPGKEPMKLVCTCEDWDEVSGSDFMGQFSVELDELKDQKVLKKWFKLSEAEGRKGSVAGHVLLHVQWRHDPAIAFEPFSEDTSDKTPNELRIGLFKARDLVIADKNLLSKGGSSDPRVKLSIAGTAWNASSKVIKKSLEPVWKETFVVPLPHVDLDGWTKPTLTLAVEDWDEISSADAMGTVDIPLTPDHAITRDWYALQQNDKGLPKEISGEVNLVMQWRYNPDLDYDPFSEQIEYPEEEPNELRLAIVQARGLAIMDKNLLSKGGSSDPFVEVTLSSAKKAKKTSVKKKTLEPAFHEQFQWSVSPSSSGDQPSLTLNVQDWDAVSKNDAMGSVEIGLDTLLDRKGEPLRKWYGLDTGGAIEVIVQWRHSPTNAWKPFAPPKFPDKAPNELRVGLSQGRELAVKDKNLLSKGGSSDPYCKFSLTGTNVTFNSTVQNKTVDPVWREIFTQPLPDLEPLPKLRVECFDRDAVSKDDSMGSFEVDLTELRNQAVSKKWYALDEGEVELILQWYHDPALAYDPFEAPAAEDAMKTPNELCVAVSQGRNLVIKDSNIFSSGGTSDPRAILNVVGGSSVKLSHTTDTLKKTLNPRWREVWTVPLTGNGGETLHCRVEDVDEISAADFMGATEGIDLSQLKPNTITRKWYSLAQEDPLSGKKCKGDVHGDVELIILWRYNASLDWDPFDRENISDGPVNELRIAAFRGRKLAIRDKNLFSAGGSSDPKLTFALSTAGEAKHSFKTKAIKTTLDPIWKEQFCFPLKPDDCGGTCVLEVQCEDADTISSNDAMGSVSIDLMPLQGKIEQKWYVLEGEGAEGAIELIIQWRHDPTRHEAELDAKARKEAKAAEDAKRKAQEAEREAAEQQRLADEAERKRKALEEAEARRREKDAAEARRRADEEARLKALAEEKEKKRLEDEARRNEELEKLRKERAAAAERKKEEEAERAHAKALADAENARKLAEQKALDDAAAARRREAARKRRAELEEAARLRKSEEDARRDAARKARAEADAKRQAAEARRRDEARARLRAEAEVRAKRAAAARARRREAALKLKADEDARFAADEAYRENLRQARAEALSKATIERQKREAIEDRKREKELVKALGDGSRNWRPDASSRFGSKPDTHAFLPKAKRTTGGE